MERDRKISTEKTLKANWGTRQRDAYPWVNCRNTVDIELSTENHSDDRKLLDQTLPKTVQRTVRTEKRARDTVVL